MKKIKLIVVVILMIISMNFAKAEEDRKKLFNNYLSDGKKNWEKNKSHFKGSYISEDMAICSKLVEDQ